MATGIPRLRDTTQDALRSKPRSEEERNLRPLPAPEPQTRPVPSRPRPAPSRPRPPPLPESGPTARGGTDARSLLAGKAAPTPRERWAGAEGPGFVLAASGRCCPPALPAPHPRDVSAPGRPSTGPTPPPGSGASAMPAREWRGCHGEAFRSPADASRPRTAPPARGAAGPPHRHAGAATVSTGPPGHAGARGGATRAAAPTAAARPRRVVVGTQAQARHPAGRGAGRPPRVPRAPRGPRTGTATGALRDLGAGPLRNQGT